MKKKYENYFITEIGLFENPNIFIGYEEGLDSIKFYAAKRIEQKTITESKENEARHDKELKILQLFQNPRIMQFYTSIKSSNYIYLIFKLTDSETLSSFLKNYRKIFLKPISQKLIQHFLTQIIETIKYIHSRRYIHRDLKLSNFMITFTKEKLKLIIEKYNLSKSLTNTIGLQTLLNDYNKKIYNFEKDFPDLFYYNEDQFLVNHTTFDEIMLMSELKLLDFSMSNNVDEYGNTSTIVITNPDCISPEMINKLSNKDISTNYNNLVDIWTVGCFLFNFITNEYPFPKENNNIDKDNINNFKKKLEDGTYKINLKNIDVSYEQVDFLIRLLQKNESQRLNSDMLGNHSFIKNNIIKFHKIKKEDLNPDYVEGDNLVLNINTRINIKDIRLKESESSFNQSDYEIDSECFLNSKIISEKNHDYSRIISDKINFEYDVIYINKMDSHLSKHFKEVNELMKKRSNEDITLSTDDQRTIYGLLQQIEIGNVNTVRPGLLYFNAKADWDEWNSLKGMRKDQAKHAYVVFCKTKLPKNLADKFI